MLRSVAIVSGYGYVGSNETDSAPGNQHRDDNYVYQFQISAFELRAMKLFFKSLDKTLKSILAVSPPLMTFFF